MNANPDYRLFYPMRYGHLNTSDYASIQQAVGDLQIIWTESIKTELEIEDADFRVCYLPSILLSLHTRLTAKPIGL
jgi:actin-related protein 8